MFRTSSARAVETSSKTRLIMVAVLLARDTFNLARYPSITLSKLDLTTFTGLP